jgi:hypothetical protein
VEVVEIIAMCDADGEHGQSQFMPWLCELPYIFLDSVKYLQSKDVGLTKNCMEVMLCLKTLWKTEEQLER